jgi:hypothetical protein
MDLPPPDARQLGVLFEHRGTTHAIGARCGGEVPSNASEQCAEISSADHARLFDFESELEATLTYIPLAVRFKLDKCGIKLSLDAWQLLPEDRRRELLRAPCDKAKAIASYRQVLCSFVREASGDKPPLVSIPADSPSADVAPEQITRATAALGLPPPSSAGWRKLTPLQRFALVKLSREGREHRNLAAALREFGLL